MDEEIKTQERKVWEATQRIVENLIEFDAEDRKHILKTVLSQFGVGWRI